MVSPELLRRYPFFAMLNDEQLKAIAMIAREQTYGQGTLLVRFPSAGRGRDGECQGQQRGRRRPTPRSGRGACVQPHGFQVWISVRGSIPCRIRWAMQKAVGFSAADEADVCPIASG